MNIKQLKADYQLAELRLNSDKSEKNQTIFKQAKKEYESALKSATRGLLISEPVITDNDIARGKKLVDALKTAKPATLPKPAALPKNENPKIEPVSGENQKPDTSADTQQNGDASGQNEQLPANTETSGDAGSEPEKKTEVNP